MKIEIHVGSDPKTQQMWFVDSPEKFPRLVRNLSLKMRPRELDRLKALVYDTERQGQDCVVDVEGWTYDSRRLRGLAKGLFAQPPESFLPDRPANH